VIYLSRSNQVTGAYIHAAFEPTIWVTGYCLSGMQIRFFSHVQQNLIVWRIQGSGYRWLNLSSIHSRKVQADQPALQLAGITNLTAQNCFRDSSQESHSLQLDVHMQQRHQPQATNVRKKVQSIRHL
jgi:hypothetical protein